ncbi:hypothetical protein [Candidatus Uabimicrobium sp. HlEnr_7]|uniref:hypothetical protein n=1 Tax=Candidatus Uabimicrobium helgolandensis TaxID=3095367 RepID=UPI0035576EFA
MKKLTILFIFFSLSYIAADEQKQSLFDKITVLKDKVKTYFEDAPRLSFRQRLKIGVLLKGHRKEIRSMVDELRSNIIRVRKSCRGVLTHQQLLQSLEFKDQLILRPKGEKIAMLLQRFSKEHRVEFLQLIHKIWSGETQNISQNLENLHIFVIENIMPYRFEYLQLTVDQQQQIKAILEEEKHQIQPLLLSLLTKAHKIRDKVKSKLSITQINFFESNRQKVVQDILQFVESL